MQAKNTLQFIYDRLTEIHGENPNSDYMLCLKKIIESDQETKKEGFKTITFKSGKTLDITPEHFVMICEYLEKYGHKGGVNLKTNDVPVQVVNCEEIAFIK